VYDHVYNIKNNVLAISDYTSRLITTHWISSQAHKWAEKSVAVAGSWSG